MKKTSWTFALLLALGPGWSAHAQDDMGMEADAADTITDTTVESAGRGTNVEVETTKSGTTTKIQNTDGSSTTIRSLQSADEDIDADAISADSASDATAGALVDDEAVQEAAPSTLQPALEPAPAVAETRADTPRWWPSSVRVIPTAGASSFTTADKLDFDNFDRGFTAGAFLDFGGGPWVFETGVLALQTRGTADASTGAAAFDVDSWGIPLLAKWNMSGHPNSTVFLKAGAMPFQPDGTSDDFDVLGVAGIGAAIPLFRNTALTLEGSYNRLFDDGGELGAYSGVAFLGGLSFGL